MSSILIIGYGNAIRSDDGAGLRAAEEIARRSPRGVRVLTTHGLTPELAEEIARSGRVIFIDASLRAESVLVRPVAATAQHPENLPTHLLDPSLLLGLTQTLYGKLPEESLLVEIPARSVELGEHLSPETERFVNEAVALVLDRCRHT